MFTGIIESTATIIQITENGTNRSFRLESPLGREFSVDQSVSHNGVCLTVESVENNTYQVTAIAETLAKTNLGQWKIGDIVNLERCLQMNGRLDGHFVQGHTDTAGAILDKKDLNGSWEFTIAFDPAFAPNVVEKGSIALNGISLTVFNVGLDRFTVAIIPYTYEHTNLGRAMPGELVNLEFDLLGKYMLRWAQTGAKGNLR